MLHQEFNEGKRPRGRPFVKGNRFGKPPVEILDDSRREISYGGEALKKEVSIVMPEPENEPVEQENEQEIENKIDSDEIVFLNGENKISIKFFKCEQRRFHIKLMLNDEIEIRPMNFSGGKNGRLYWKMLKDSLGVKNGIDKETH